MAATSARVGSSMADGRASGAGQSRAHGRPGVRPGPGRSTMPPCSASAWHCSAGPTMPFATGLVAGHGHQSMPTLARATTAPRRARRRPRLAAWHQPRPDVSAELSQALAALTRSARHLAGRPAVCRRGRGRTHPPGRACASGTRPRALVLVRPTATRAAIWPASHPPGFGHWRPWLAAPGRTTRSTSPSRWRSCSAARPTGCP
jgi:hypothetical protein